MIEEVLQNIQSVAVPFVFHPLLLGFLIVCYVVGRALGKFIPLNIVHIMLGAFIAYLLFKAFVIQNGYEFGFVLGVPFMGGLWQGARKWSY